VPARLDWWLALAFVVVGLLLAALGVIPAPDALALLGASLRNPYYTGPALVLLIVWGESILRLRPGGKRGGLRGVWLVGIILVSGYFFRVLPETFTDQWISQLYLAAALGASVVTPALALYLLSGGLLSLREFTRATARWVGVFGPFLVFILGAGFGTALIARVSPEVDDPRLLRMDESLGFHAAPFFGSFDYVGTWLWDGQFVLYAGIGVLVMTVAGRLFLRDECVALRRFLLSIILSGLLGWLGYWMVPAVGPTTAYPELFAGPPASREAALQQALADTTPMTQPAEFPRDCAPSMHTTWALLALLAAFPQGRRFFLLMLPLGVMSVVTTLTLCKHYTADLVLAVPFVIFCWSLADLLTRPMSLELRGGKLRLAGGVSVAFGLCLVGWWIWGQRAPLPPILVWPAILAFLCPLVVVASWMNRRLSKFSDPT